MTEILEIKVFFTGLVVGISFYQGKVVSAHEKREPLKIGEKLYYLQDGRERLQEAIDKMCR